MDSPLRIAGIFLLGIVFSIGAVVGVVLWSQQEPGSPGEARSRQVNQEEVESPENRIWRAERLGERVNLHRDMRDSLGRALILDRHGKSLFVGDFRDMRIKQFNPAGNFVRAYGLRSSRGEEAFVHFLGYALTDSGRLFVLDHAKREMTAFEVVSGERLFTKPLDYQPYRLTAVGNRVVAHAAMTDTLFRVYDHEGELLNMFSPLPKNMENGAFAIAGDLIPYEEQEQFIYVPSGASYLYYFDLEGNERRRVITPDRILFRARGTGKFSNMQLFGDPEEEDSTDANGPAPFEKTRNYDVDTDGRYIYMSVSKLDHEHPEGYSLVDVFELETGAYVESFELPTTANDVVVMDGILYYLDRDTDSIRAHRLGRRGSSGEAAALDTG